MGNKDDKDDKEIHYSEECWLCNEGYEDRETSLTRRHSVVNPMWKSSTLWREQLLHNGRQRHRRGKPGLKDSRKGDDGRRKVK